MADAHRQRLLGVNGASLPGVRERMVTKDGVVRFVKTQNVEPIFSAIRAVQEQPNVDKGRRYVGSVPILVAQRWARECGAAIGTKEWRAYANRKLKDGEFAKLVGR